jgi:HK97 family phage prohead protease
MTMLYRTIQRSARSIGAREFTGVAATSDLQDDGFALVMSGGDISRLRNNGVLLFNHDTARIIGRITSIRATATNLLFGASFASPGVSRHADEACGLLKESILTNISLGFNVDKAEPINPQRRADGMLATKWTAYEISLVAVGMDVGASVTERSLSRLSTSQRADLERRRAAAARLAPGVALSRTERLDALAGFYPAARSRAVAELMPRPSTHPDPAHHAEEMREYLERRCLAGARGR